MMPHPNSEKHQPVIIIGAGPAGAAASIFLSKEKIPHLLVDKAVFPRDKICGDACSGKSLEVLRKANPDWISEIQQLGSDFLPSNGINFIAPNGKTMSVPFKVSLNHNDIIGITSPRFVLDNFIFSKCQSAYATILQGIAELSIKPLEHNQHQVTFSHNGSLHTFNTAIIIAADGDKSTTAKALTGKQDAEKTVCVGLRAYYKGVEDLDRNNFIELHYINDLLPGYFWIFPLPNGMANVGCGMLSKDVRKRNINLREAMMHVIETHPVISKRFKNATLEGKLSGWGLPLAMKRRPISGLGYMLAGDAAHLVDPFSGEGIGNALYSGMLAAWAARDALAQQNFDAAFLSTHYDDAVYRYFGDEFRISKTIQKLCNYPWVFNLIVNKASKSKSLRESFSGMFMDLQVRNQLSKPSFYLKILMNQ